MSPGEAWSVCLSVFRASILRRVGEADSDTVSLPLAEPGPAADSGFLFDVDVPCWVSEPGFNI